MSAHERHNELAPRLLNDLVQGVHGDANEAMGVLESLIVGVMGYFRPGDVRAQTILLESVTERAVERLLP